MSQDMTLQPQKRQPSIDEISSPFSVQFLELLDPDLLQDTLQSSEVTSGLNCQDPDKNGSYQDNSITLSSTTNESNINNKNNNKDNNHSNNNNNTGELSMIFDSADEFGNDISASIDFSSSPQFLEEIGQEIGVVVQSQNNNLYTSSVNPLAVPAGSLSQLSLQETIFEEESLSSIPSYNEALTAPSPTCSFLGSTGLPTGLHTGLATDLPAYMNMNAGISAETSGIFSSSILSGSNLLPADPMVDFQGDSGGIFCSDSIRSVFGPGSSFHQALGGGGGGGECHAAVMGGGAAVPTAPPSLRAEIAGLDDPTFSKAGKLSVEQRKEKIHKFMTKRKQRNFNKKIKYACRKTLADSRPRVRGRFAKNEEFGEAQRHESSTHHDYDNDDEVGVKEEDQMVCSSDILAQLGGENTPFKGGNHPIQSWFRDFTS